MYYSIGLWLNGFAVRAGLVATKKQFVFQGLYALSRIWRAAGELHAVCVEGVRQPDNIIVMELVVVYAQAKVMIRFSQQKYGS